VTWLDLDGTANARVVGGLPTVDGRTTRSGVLLRADNLQDLTPRDVERLRGELRVRTVLDLRSTGEVHLTGPGPLKATDVVHHHLSLIPEWDGEPDRLEVERALPRLPDRPRQRSATDLEQHYVGYVRQAGDRVATALRVLADPASGTTLVPCAAGKDRTGVVVALALSLAGVTRAAVVADYVRSAERAEGILARLKATDAYGPSLAQTTAAEIVPVAASMEGFLDDVDRRYGGPHGLAMSIGVDEETVARLAGRLVGPSPHAGVRP
jgi:protein tyrosine/serine phosphatase